MEMKFYFDFDDAANQNVYGVGALLIAPDESHNPIAIKLKLELRIPQHRI